MINLYTSYFISEDKKRQSEIDLCLKKNIENDLIKTIYLIIEEPIEFNIPKIKTVLIKGRPTYNVFFDLINQNTTENEWNIISNTDIYFDNTLHLLKKYSKSYCLALTRYEVTQTGIRFLNLKDSQDCWIFKGNIRKIEGDFTLGTAGCDNAIANRIWKSGYQVINPSKSIKSYHVHTSQHRTYDVNAKVPQPYLLLNPCA